MRKTEAKMNNPISQAKETFRKYWPRMTLWQKTRAVYYVALYMIGMALKDWAGRMQTKADEWRRT